MSLSPAKPDYAAAVTFFDPLDPNDIERHRIEPGVVFFDWIKEVYPTGFGRPIKLLVNGDELPLEEMDFEVKAGDVISIIVMPGSDPITIALVAALISAVATIAASVVVNLIFGKPKKPKDQAAADPVYSLQGGHNMVRLGEPIPAVYGKVITYPDAATMPYSFFHENEMYIDQILCIGQGEYQINNTLIGTTSSSSLAPGIMLSTQFAPWQHGQVMGTIQNATGIRENMVTSIEVSDQELNGFTSGNPSSWIEVRANSRNSPNRFYLLDPPFPASLAPSSKVYYYAEWPITNYDAATGVITVDPATPGSTVGNADNIRIGIQPFNSADAAYQSGPFITSNPGFPGTYIEVDFVWPAGMYVMEDDGDLVGKQVDMTVVAEQIDDNNVPTGGVVNFDISHSWDKQTPSRITRGFSVPLGRYRVKVIRHTAADANSKVKSTFNWTGLKFMLANVGTPVYGNTTLLAVRLKATNGIASDAANKIRVDVTRKLPRFGSGGLVPTRSPADAFIDIATNTIYGLGRPLATVDVPLLQSMEAHWGGYALFDAIFSQKTTIWDALTVTLQVVAASPVMTGKMLSLVSDGRKIAPAQLFSDANIVEDTFQATYSFDRPGEYAGIQVEYRDPVNFQPAYVQYPPGAVDLENVVLFGCTNKTIAEQYCLLLWQRRIRLRQYCVFETEMEGFIPMVSSRVLVSTDTVAWGEAGEVISALSSTSLLLDRTVDFSKYSSPFIVLRNSNGQPTAKIGITPGANARTVNLASAIPITIFPILSDKRATIWAVGDTQRKVKDFTVQKVEHIGENTTKVEAVIYDERTWDNTLAFLSVPI